MTSYEDEPLLPDAPIFLTRRTNKAGVALIKEFEGLRLTPYRCPGRVWTIGFGHTRDIYPDMKITREQAEEFLRADLRPFEKAVNFGVNVPLSHNQFSALVCFAFNVGAENFKNSTLLKLLNRGWYEQVPAQFSRWNKANGEVLGGLARRRAAEARLWNTPDPPHFPDPVGQA